MHELEADTGMRSDLPHSVIYFGSLSYLGHSLVVRHPGESQDFPTFLQSKDEDLQNGGFGGWIDLGRGVEIEILAQATSDEAAEGRMNVLPACSSGREWLSSNIEAA